MRELKRLQFMAVDKPRIDVECAGHVLSSSVIQNSKKNPNFDIIVKQFDVVSIKFRAPNCPGYGSCGSILQITKYILCSFNAFYFVLFYYKG